MILDTYLLQGSNAAALSKSLSQTFEKPNLSGLSIFSLGVENPIVLDALKSASNESNLKFPVYLCDSYGIIGYEQSLGRNIELMEKGRGQEYGFRGGSGGEGCLVTAFGDGAVLGHDTKFPSNAATLMVVADTSGQWGEVASKAPVHYGGVTKQIWKVKEGSDQLEQVPYVWVAAKEKNGQPTGISTFTGDARRRLRRLFLTNCRLMLLFLAKSVCSLVTHEV